MLSRHTEFLAGVKAELPILLGVSPFGLIYGVLAAGAGIPAWAALAMSSIVFAGSAQFVAVPLLAANAPAMVILATTAVVNLRHLLYATSLAPHLAALERRWKALLAYVLTDEVYAVAITRFSHAAHAPAQAPHAAWYFLGAGVAQWSAWQASTAVGLILGAQVPASWGLDFTIALTFIALLVPAVSDRPTLIAALVGGAAALVGAAWPYKLGLIVAACAGIGAGVGAELLGRGRGV